MYNFTDFGLRDMTECGTKLRKIGAGATSMEEVADRIVNYFYDNFTATNQPALALVRLFKTAAYQDLEPELQAAVQQMLGQQPDQPEMKCLTLLGTRGQQADWNSRHNSRGHQAIPLVDEQFVGNIPMIFQLITQLGLDVSSVLQPDPDLVIDLAQKTFNVFHVAEALGSPHIPAQEGFILPYGVKSVLGFGTMLPSGNLIAIIMFSQVAISRETADLFKTLVLNIKVALLPFEGKTIFAPMPMLV